MRTTGTKSHDQKMESNQQTDLWRPKLCAAPCPLIGQEQAGTVCHGQDGQETDWDRCLLLGCSGESPRRPLPPGNAVADDLTDGEELSSGAMAALMCGLLIMPASQPAFRTALHCCSRLLLRRPLCGVCGLLSNASWWVDTVAGVSCAVTALADSLSASDGGTAARGPAASGG